MHGSKLARLKPATSHAKRSRKNIAFDMMGMDNEQEFHSLTALAAHHQPILGGFSAHAQSVTAPRIQKSRLE